MVGNGIMEPVNDTTVEAEEEVKMPVRGHVKNLIRMFTNGTTTGG